MLDVRLFGSPLVGWRGGPFRFRSPRKTLSLLAYLLLHREERIDRHHLAFMLWPDAAEEDALANLRRNLYLLASNLPGGPAARWLDVEPSHLRWRTAESTRCDVWDFQAAAADAERIAEAAALYRGELLSGIDDDWIVDARARLEATFSAALQAGVARERSRGRFTSAVAHAQRLMLLDPLREDALRLLATVRHESGDRAGALAEVDRFVARLREELEVAPMDETVALRARIERDEFADREVLHPVASTTSPRGVMLPFVGRRAELERLHAAWERSGRGGSRIVLVGGEAGIGKSRLIAEFAQRVVAEGARVARGVTASRERIDYEVLFDALRDGQPFLAAAKLDTRTRYALARLLPELGFDSAPWSAGNDALERDPQLVRDALAQAFSALARRPLLIVLEDVQHAGAATLDVIARLALRGTAFPMLFAMTYRSEDVSRAHPLRAMRRELESRDRVLEIVLGPLTERETLELAGDTLGDAKLLAAFHAQSEGNPLFIGELLRDEREGGGAGGGGGGVERDRGIGAIVTQRLQRLDPSTHLVAELAAVAGDAFEVEVLREAGGWSDEIVRAAVDELLDRAIVRETRRGARYAFAFAHRSLRDALYGVQPNAVRMRRHRRIGSVLEQLFAEPSLPLAAIIAEHFDRGGDAPGALRWHLRVADAAIRVGAFRDALAAATRCMALAGEEPPAELAILVARAAFGLGRYDDAEQAATEGRAHAAARGEIAALVSAVVVLADVAADRGDEARTRALLGEAEGAARSEGDRILVARVGLHAARAATMRQDHAAAYDHAAMSLRLFHEAAVDDGEAEAATLLGYLAARRGSVEEARNLLAQARARYEAGTNAYGAYGIGGVAVSESHLFMRAGRIDEALASIRHAFASYHSIDDARGCVVAKTNLSFCLHRSGDAAGARDAARVALILAREIGHVPLETNALGNLAAALTDLDQLDEALASFEIASRLRAGIGRPLDELSDRVEIVATLLRRGDTLRAGVLAEALAESPDAKVIDELSWPFYRDWVVAWSRRSRGAAARASLERAFAGVAAMTDALPDQVMRARFRACPIPAAIARSYETDRWPEPAGRTI